MSQNVPVRFYSGVALRPRSYVDASGNLRGVRSELAHREIVIPIKYSDGTSLVTTNFKLPATSLITAYPRVFVRVAETTGATKTIKVGLGATAAAIINGLSVATAGLVQPTLTNAAVTLGTSLFVYGGATSTAPVFEPLIVSTTSAITWTPGSADYANLDADIIIEYAVLGDLTLFQNNVEATPTQGIS